jgi:hypothetical protein
MVQNLHKAVPQFGIAELVNITPITWVYGDYTPNINWGDTTLYYSPVY